jgi:hypothetical protein
MAKLEALARVVKLDFDRRKVSWGRLARRLIFLERLMHIDPLEVVIHRTKHGYHVRIALGRKFPPIAIVALQACLGSDYRREILNLERIVVGGKFANILFNNSEKRLVFWGDWDTFLRWARER